MVELIGGDCRAELKRMNDDGIMVDAIIADIPYNIGQAKWDLNFDLNELLPYLHKIVKIC